MPPTISICSKSSPMKTQTKTLRYIQYARKSSQGESRQVASLDDQERTLREVVSREGLLVVQRLAESKSAKAPGIRPLFKEMIDLIKAGKADAILCWHVNRLARNSLESGELQWLLHEGILRCIKTPEREYHPEDHALLMAVESSMAAQYVRDLRRDVARGVREKAERGWYPFKAKAGYLIDPITRDLIPDPVRFPLLRGAFLQLLTGLYSVPQVLDELNSKGYRTQRTRSGGNKPISRSSLYRLFTDTFYAGEYEYDGKDFEGRHEAMVSKSEFAKVQRLLGRPLRPKAQQHPHPYAGIMRCGNCGCQITAETHVKSYKQTGTTRSYTYYHCTGRKGCRKLSHTATDVDQAVLNKLDGCKIDPYFAEWAIAALKREGADFATLSLIAAGTVSDSEKTIKRKLDALYSMREDGELSKEEFLERKHAYKTSLDKLSAESTLQSNKVMRDRESLINLLVFRKDAMRVFLSDVPDRKRQVAMAFHGDYVLTPENLSISVHPGLTHICTIEPLKNQDQQIDSGGPDSSDSTWRTILDELRTLVTDSDLDFPQPAWIDAEKLINMPEITPTIAWLGPEFDRPSHLTQGEIAA